MNNLINHEVTTKITGGHITIETSCIIQGIRDRISRQVIDTQDAAIREALIKLGWTPPASTKESTMITLAQIASKQKELEAMLNEYKALQITHITLAATKIDLAPGERYAGLVFEDDGQPHHHLILLPGDFVGEWDDAARWAFNRGGRLPTRREGAILYANMGKLSSTWIWLLEENDDHYAWRQFAADCHQIACPKNQRQAAIAVRAVLLDGSAS